MHPLRTACFFLFGCAVLHAADIDYDAALKDAMKLYPPGDYHVRPVRGWPPSVAYEKPIALPTIDLLAPVEPSDKGVKTLVSEAAGYFLSGRWDLSIKRYKQVLLASPDNRDAKAHLYDFMVFYALCNDGSRDEEAGRKYWEMHEQLANGIAPKEPK